jgi:Fur family peroxide stress response transcriptional regulator
MGAHMMTGFQRMTTQRRLILQALRSTTSHPTADWVYNRVREDLPNVSLGTIYRNLRALVEMGEAQSLSYGSGQDRFDGNAAPHYHFRCLECGRVYDVPMSHRPELDQEAAKSFPGQVAGHRLEFYGTCGGCLREKGRTPSGD